MESLGPEACEGYLLKRCQNTFRSWYHARYFQITKHSLDYYKDETKRKLRGNFDLRGLGSVVQEGHQLTLNFIAPYSLELHLQAGSAVDAARWREMLERVPAKNNIGKVPLTPTTTQLTQQH